MRTDERAGQAAKFELRELEEKLQRFNDAISYLTPNEVFVLESKITLLKKVCGTE